MKKMSLFLFALLVALLFVGCSSEDESASIETPTQTETPEEVQEAESTEDAEVAALENPIHGGLSRIEYNGNVAYLFGTMHAAMPHWFPLDARVYEALARADVLALEADMSPAGEAEMMAAMAEFLIPDEGQSAAELLSEEEFAAFVEILAEYGVDAVFVEMFAPWTLSILSMEAVLSEVGLSAETGLEYYLIEVAADLPVIGLNEIAHEVALLFGLSEEAQIAAARYFPSFDEAVVEMQELLEAYKNQDVAALTALVRLEPTNALERYMEDVVIIQRSIEFAQEVIRLLQETDEPTTFFVAVGIGHLVGDDHGNMLQYFIDAGFEVESLYR